MMVSTPGGFSASTLARRAGRGAGPRTPPAGVAGAAGGWAVPPLRGVAGGARVFGGARVPARRGRAAAGHGRRAGECGRPERGVRRLTDAHPSEPGRRTYLDGVRAAAPIGVAALAFGVSFGGRAPPADMGRVAPVVMSVTPFAGSAQFAVASILGAGGGLVTAIVAAVLLNLRYGPIGLSAAGAFEGPWWKRALLAQFIVDESWAIAQRDDGRFDRYLLVGGDRKRTRL